MKPRPIKTKQEGNRELALIPLGRNDAKYAEVYKDDYDFLVKLGLSPNWRTNNKNYVIATAPEMAGGHALVARVLMDAQVGQIVRFADGNPLNLRRENLRLARHAHGKLRARNYVRAREAA